MGQEIAKGVNEIEIRPISGWFPLAIALGLVFGGIATFIFGVATRTGTLGLLGGGLVVAGVITSMGFMAVAPNDARVLLLFGKYKGSVRASGFYWVNPFFKMHKLSLRIRNFETGSRVTTGAPDATGNATKTRSGGVPSKVNDRDGNPIEISAVVVWRVVETAEALFEVDDYNDFVRVQSEAALRSLASRHPYDSEDHETSLRGNVEEISLSLRNDIQERLAKAGVDVIESRISHLAYAPEIAGAMLQRQQAQAVVAARTRIVDGAVGMVEMALERIARDKIVHLDDERRAAMVSNLMVVLCSGGHAQPVVNAGSLYH
jgi:regulator of protease activity HflC (stomatin/prohibitin superfamily)